MGQINIDTINNKKTSLYTNSAQLPSDSTVHVNELENGEQIRKTQAVAHNALASLTTPTLFPDLASAAVDLVLAQEKKTERKISDVSKTIDDLRLDRDLLLNAMTELAAIPDNAKTMPENLKATLTQLKDRGMDLWKQESFDVSEKKLSSLKSLLSTHMDTKKQEIPVLFSKMQTMVQVMSSIIEISKKILENEKKAIEKTLRIP